MRTSPARSSLDLLNNIWIPFQDDVEIAQPEGIYRTRERLDRFQGCDNVIENLVITPDEKVARWQERLEPLNKRIAGGCHLTRRIADHIEKAGFDIEKLDTYYFEGEPKPMGYTYEGRAVSR